MSLHCSHRKTLLQNLITGFEYFAVINICGGPISPFSSDVLSREAAGTLTGNNATDRYSAWTDWAVNQRGQSAGDAGEVH